MSSSIQFQDIINFDFPGIGEETYEKIYTPLIEFPPLTAVIGAKCSDGIVLIADRRLTKKNGSVIYKEKIFGDLKNVLIGYTGDAEMFDIFRRYTVGDVMINRDRLERYTFNNLLDNVATTIKRFNEIGGRPFKVLLVTEHRLFYINVDGNSSEETYKIIGSGEKTADMFLKKQVSELTMKDCAKYAYLAIIYMDQYCPGLGVGVEPDHTPDIMYIARDKTTQHRAPPGDILEFKKFTEERLEQFRLSFDKIIKE